ncbi:SpoIID/LytB domain-containing protein [Halomicronema sp. CCY15110]|uniref:SpoIID/LytB domain-containing protein n=1 Tax=Halomicronema sp. CCY15110 TaxID=2767773 RepID=UPI00195232F7|nr:SpoIID/LytB domain-containing protein [Halomicronema sp. CCY15110]
MLGQKSLSVATTGKLSGLLLAASVAVVGNLLSPAAAPAQQPQNPVLQIGIVQRFGRDDAKTLIIEPLDGAQLTVQFKTGEQLETLTTNQIVLDTAPVSLETTSLRERVVLSTHRSFESAEDSANQWRDRGIETEIAQPGDWQVWADRDVYSTPLLRRLLLQDLQAAGYDNIYVDSQVLRDEPKAAAIFNGFRYNRDIVSIIASNQRVRVIEKYGDVEDTVRVYGGNLRLQPNAYGTYTLVNQVPIETYLRGVVPYEIGLAAPPTTVEAQAILARTYVLRNLRRFEVDNYELCADTQCQVYRGITGAADKTDRAITNTRGLVLTYGDELVDALYSSNAGGVTAAFSHVWNGPDRPYLQPVVDSVVGSWDLATRPLTDENNLKAFLSLESGFNEETWDTFRWSEDASLEKIGQDLKTYLQARNHPLANFTEVQRLVVTERAPSGRVQTLQIATDAGVVTLQKDEVIRAIEAPLSLLFYTAGLYEPVPGAAEPQLQGYRFVGGGFGHGVGMSQTGAYNLGDLNWSAERILKFYYPGTELQPISDALVFWRDPAETSTGSPAETTP